MMKRDTLHNLRISVLLMLLEKHLRKLFRLLLKPYSLYLQNILILA